MQLIQIKNQKVRLRLIIRSLSRTRQVSNTRGYKCKLPNTFNPRFSYASSKILGEVLTYNYLRSDLKK